MNTLKGSTKLIAVPTLALLGLFYLGRGRPKPQNATLASSGATDPGVISLLRQSLASPFADSRAAALEWISRNSQSQDDALIQPIFGALKDADGGVRNAALRNMGWIYKRHQHDAKGRHAFAAIQAALEQTSESKADRSARLVVVDLLRGSEEFKGYTVPKLSTEPNPLLTDQKIQSLIASYLTNAQSTLRPQLLGVVANSATLQAVPAIVQGVGACLEDDNLTVRSSAVDLLIAINKRGDPAERREVHPLLLTSRREGDPNVQLRASKALGLPIPPRPAAAAVVSLTGGKVAAADVPFDFNYFTAFVQPLFLKKYGNNACVDCHTPQTNSSGSFRILAPGPSGRYTLEQSRVNFVSTLSVINRKDPERSKLLLKPLDPRTNEGTVHGMEHDGGVFWTNQYDPDFEIVRDWLKGGKLETPPEKQLDFAYFVKHVEPIFATPGPDGIACMNCHSTHAILHLLSPETREGKFSVEQLVNNYQSAHRVVDEAAPTDSFIVRKPTSLREGEPGGLSHAGGIRWPEKTQSWQYRALITWIGMHNLAGSEKQYARGSSH
ncbi:MAG: hypothetical protein ACRD3T_04830 [Terriglobia bacterium]